MAQKRHLKTGQIGVANTVYIPKASDDLISRYAKERSKVEKVFVSKSRLIVEAVVEKYPA